MTMLECQKYRKKPVVIEAIRYSGDNLAEVLAFTGKHPRFDEWFSSFDEYAAHVASDRLVFKILTLEGTMEASPGDWIIKGVKGEFYPCKPDIFAATYEPTLSTITPAEVGGLWVPANPEHAKLGWSYDFEQTERIARAAYDSTGYDATMEVVEFVMAEADRRYATALAAKDAELAAVKANCETVCNSYADENQRLHDRAERAEAQRDEALKALEEIGSIRTELQSSHDYSRGWNDALFRARQIARRVREGGKVDG